MLHHRIRLLDSYRWRGCVVTCYSGNMCIRLACVEFLREDRPESWVELKKRVDARCGLPHKALIDAIFAMEVAPN